MATKSPISAADIEHLSKLASLPLSEDQKEKLSGQLPSVLKFFDKLQEINTDGVEPFLGEKASKPLRSDETRPSLTKQEALSNSRFTHNDLFVVDAVFEES